MVNRARRPIRIPMPVPALRPSGAKSWILLAQADGKRRDIGLGAGDLDSAKRVAFGPGDDGLGEAWLMHKRPLSFSMSREA